jgi:hypothetical protein
MSQQLSRKDSEYGVYAGGDFQDAKKIARIDLVLKFKLFPEKFRPMLELYREYLIKNRKAYFATLGSTEITKLGFLLGWKDDSVSF